mmetsp:Transcript_10489/g.20265  ORF Transcript_10489/g.20265 Transcript_10489/m.20265 type:complete len:207 (+) Transcript_10489:171-791(+)
MSVAILPLGDDDAASAIAEEVQKKMGVNEVIISEQDALESTVNNLVVIVECEADGGLCDRARKFLRQLKKSEVFSSNSAAVHRRVAILSLARSTCAFSAAQGGDGKFRGGLAIQNALLERGCTPLVPIGKAEIETEEVSERVLPWASTVATMMQAESARNENVCHSKCPCNECTCGPDCACAPGKPGCDPCGLFQAAQKAAAAQKA